MLGTTLFALCVLAGCVERDRPLSFSVTELESPAGEDSGEPFLSSTGDGVLMSWIGRSPAGGRHLLLSSLVSGAWTDPRVITEGDRMLVNASDFPSVVPGSGDTLWAHWLERDAEGFGYGIRVVRTGDGGRSWTDPWTPHEDGTPTEHGFVSLVPLDGELGILWLDGRGFVGMGDEPPSMETTLFFRTLAGDGEAGVERPLDARVCDCCQTDWAATSDGGVFVYRDRSPGEIRDIRVMRLEGDAWTDEGLVHADRWETGACPVNGPAVAATANRVAVAWFTAADADPRVQVAFSEDAGRAFGPPTRVDDGAPAGRADVVMLPDGTALVSWVERTGGEGSEVRLRRVSASGRLLEGVRASAPFSERTVGFPRLSMVGSEAILVAWTDGAELTPRVRVSRIDLEIS